MINNCPQTDNENIDKLISGRSFIAVFDSGIGGLSVLSRLLFDLPKENYLYLGDSCHAPYGDRSPAELFEFAGSIALWFKAKGAKAIALACNTVSSTIVAEIREIVAPLPVYSVLEAGVNYAVKESKSQNIGVIATAATAKSDSFAKNILARLPAAKITTIPCPAFVPLVESGDLFGSKAKRAVAELAQKLEDKNIDSLLIGCTHYPALIPLIEKALPESVKILDPALPYAKEISQAMKAKAKLNKDKGSLLLLTTGDLNQFQQAGEALFGQKPEPVYGIDYMELEKYSPLNTAHGRALAERISRWQEPEEYKRD